MANFRKKRKPKIFGFKNEMERRTRKILTFVKRLTASKIFGVILPHEKFLQFHWLRAVVIQIKIKIRLR